MNANSQAPVFLAPFPVISFNADYFEKARLLIQRNDRTHFRDWVDLAHIDELVTSVRIPPTNFNLAQGDKPLPLEVYCIGATYVDKVKVLALHQQGATIILRAAEQWSSRLNRLRVVAEGFFHCECQINVYVTPPNQKSTPPHWDTHDLLVMQIAGSKVWRLFKGKRTLPLADERFGIGEEYVSSECEEVTLHAGDTLYLPRGVIHEPVAQSYSAHLSIGIHTMRWYEVLSVALRLAAEREGSSLRTSVSHVGEQPIHPSSIDEIARITDPALLARARDILRQRYEVARAVDLQGVMTDLAGEQIDDDPSR
jgi:lysine-specific demethylase/histidyl-hydroxylase NO66